MRRYLFSHDRDAWTWAISPMVSLTAEGVATMVDSTRETVLTIMMLPLLEPFVENHRHFNEPFRLFICRLELLANATRSDMVNVIRMVSEVLCNANRTSQALFSTSGGNY